MKHALNIALAIGIVAAPAFANADAKTFRLRKDGGSRITFVSDAPLETITGVTSVATGNVTFDPAILGKTKAKIQVPVKTLRTGVDLRDEHLHGKNWLNAEKNPNITFEIIKVSGAKDLKPNTPTKVKVRGKININGVQQLADADATVRWIPFTDEIKGTPGIDNDVLRVNAKFTLKLTDHNVSVPKIVQLKVSNDIGVEVDLRAIAE